MAAVPAFGRMFAPRKCHMTTNWMDKLPPAAPPILAMAAPDEVECIVPDLAGAGAGQGPSPRKIRQSSLDLPNSIFMQTIPVIGPADAVRQALPGTRHGADPGFQHRLGRGPGRRT